MVLKGPYREVEAVLAYCLGQGERSSGQNGLRVSKNFQMINCADVMKKRKKASNSIRAVALTMGCGVRNNYEKDRKQSKQLLANKKYPPPNSARIHRTPSRSIVSWLGLPCVIAIYKETGTAEVHHSPARQWGTRRRTGTRRSEEALPSRYELLSQA